MSKDKFAFSLGNLSYIDSTYDEGASAVVKPARHDNGGWLKNLAVKFAEWRERRAVIEEMSLMTDRELSDIGLSRTDLQRVFDPSFAADHARGRDYIAY